jgi:hypothetical protein
MPIEPAPRATRKVWFFSEMPARKRGGVDARLGGEPDQAARPLAAGRDRGDEHRIVELRDQLLEALFRRTHSVPED